MRLATPLGAFGDLGGDLDGDLDGVFRLGGLLGLEGPSPADSEPGGGLDPDGIGPWGIEDGAGDGALPI